MEDVVGALAERYFKLFAGNDRSRGKCTRSGSMSTEKPGPTIDDVTDHLIGKVGLGIVPIMDNGLCWWGAIDVDNHKSKVDLDLIQITAQVERFKLPLITCRSRSGGAHLYLFCAEPLPASLINKTLQHWAKQLGMLSFGADGDADCIFPKQTKLARGDDGSMAFGNWINLPYFDAVDTARYCMNGATKGSLDYFITWAESSKVTAADLSVSLSNDHAGAPPCISHGITHGVPAGVRNEFVYNLTVYMKKAHPDDYRDRIYTLNTEIFDKPVPFPELKKTVNSASRRDYRYKCNSEPCKAWCDRNACLNQEFGITRDEAAEEDAFNNLPGFEKVIQYQTDPKRYGLIVNGTEVQLSGSQILDYRQVRTSIMDATCEIIPLITSKRWETIITPLMKTAEKCDAPLESGPAGIVYSKLREFCRKADLSQNTKEDRKLLLRGIPIAQVMDKELCVVFRGTDFVEYLRRQKAEELKGPNLWLALAAFGVKHSQMRIDNDNVRVWYVAHEKDPEVGEPDVNPEY